MISPESVRADGKSLEMNKLYSSFLLAHFSDQGVTDDVICSVDQGELTTLVLWDYSNTFDAIIRSIFLAIVYYNLHSLSNTCEIFRLSNITSRFSVIVSGDPKGLTLGPT